MSYNQLSEPLQQVMVFLFEMFGKAVLIFALLILAYAYIKTYENKKSPYLMVNLVKPPLYFMSLLTLFFSPLFIFFLAPAVTFDTVVTFLLVAYAIAIPIGGAIIGINVVFHGTDFLLAFFGIARAEKERNKEGKRIFGKQN